MTCLPEESREKHSRTTFIVHYYGNCETTIDGYILNQDGKKAFMRNTQCAGVDSND